MTCSHAACAKCLPQLVRSQLVGSRGRWQLAVWCPEPGCGRRLPQRFSDALMFAVVASSSSV